MLFGFRDLVSFVPPLDNSYGRVFLFPFSIWTHEIITGYLIMFIFGRNVAWEYIGPDAVFHGNVRLFWVSGRIVARKGRYIFSPHSLPPRTSFQQYPFWVVLGSIVELLYARVDVAALGVALVDVHFTRRVLRIALPFTLMFSPKMKLGMVSE